MIKPGAVIPLFGCRVRVIGRVGGDLPFRRRKYKVRTLEDTTFHGMVVCEGAEIYVSSNWAHGAARRAGVQTRTKYSKHDGVTFHKTRNRWYAFHDDNGRRVFLGYFIDEDMAFKARKRYLAKQKAVAA